MKKIILNSDGERLGTVTTEPFNITPAQNAPEGVTQAFAGIADVRDADTGEPPVNPEQLAAERFDAESTKRVEQAVRNTARRNNYALVDPSEATSR